MIYVHKFLLDPNEPLVIDPQYVPLHVEGFGADLWLWAEVDDDAEKQECPLYYVMTGSSPPPDASYIGTGHVDEGPGRVTVHLYRPLLTFDDVMSMFAESESVPVPDVYKDDRAMSAQGDRDNLRESAIAALRAAA